MGKLGAEISAALPASAKLRRDADSMPCQGQWMVGSLGAVPEEACAKAARAVRSVAEALGRKTGALGGGILILVVPVDTPGAMVMHRDERAVPQKVKIFAAAHQVRYVVAVGTGLFGWEPHLAEAVLAHEFAHVALGHCDSRVVRFLSQFGLFKKLFMGYELAADAFAAELGYGEALAEVLGRFRESLPTLFGRIRVAFRARRLRRVLRRRPSACERRFGRIDPEG